MKMKAILTKAFLLLIILNTGIVSVFAQGHTIQKPVRQQSTTTTTTTTTTQQKPRTNTRNNSQPSSSISTTATATKPTTGTINGHEWVDLGLSVKWATCNVGASSPSDYGNHYAWGGTRTQSEYTRENCLTYGKRMKSIAGNSAYDTARAIWGGSWRMPTKKEMEELENKCTKTWTTQGGHKGCLVTGPNGNSVFLPATGVCSGNLPNDLYDFSAGYWTATPDEEDLNFAFLLSFHGRDTVEEFGAHFCNNRNVGYSVRPVSD